MILKTIASGSKGNAYILESDKEQLLLEMGISFSRILEHIDYKKVKGCLITHEHLDHAKSAKTAINKGIRVFATQGTLNAIYGEKIDTMCRVLEYSTEYVIGGFSIIPIESEHDANEPSGFIIGHKEMGKMFFFTDSRYCRYNLKGINHYVIECNYDERVLSYNVEQGIIPSFIATRIRKTHFELNKLKEFFANKNMDIARNIVLIHISENNGNKEYFRKEIEETTRVKTRIAEDEEIICLQACPF